MQKPIPPKETNRIDVALQILPSKLRVSIKRFRPIEYAVTDNASEILEKNADKFSLLKILIDINSKKVLA